MTTLDPQLVEQRVQEIEVTDAVVLKDMHNFPTIHSVVLPKMVIALVHQGTAHMTFDHSEINLTVNDVAVFPAKHIFGGSHTSADYNATLVILGDKLVADAQLTSFSYRYQQYHIQPVTKLNSDQMSRLLLAVDMLEAVATQKDPELPHRHNALGSVLNVFFEFLHTIHQEQKIAPDNASRGAHVFAQFMDLLAANYASEHKVNFYAEKLCLTPKYMSKLIHDATGYGANAWIDQYILAKAKLLLISRNDLSVQAISQTLGFPEQASFTRFFRNLSGISPREFRGENIK